MTDLVGKMFFIADDIHLERGGAGSAVARVTQAAIGCTGEPR